MIKKVFNYLISKPWNKICDDIDQYEILKRNCKNLSEEMNGMRRMLVRPFSAFEAPYSKPACIRRHINFPTITDVCQEQRPIITESFCERFNDCGDITDDKICQNVKCPNHESYLQYIEMKRRYNIFVSEKKKFWKEKMFELKR